MSALLMVAFLVSTVLPYSLAKKWKKGILVVATIPIGIIATFIATLSVGALLHYSSPAIYDANFAVLNSLGASGISIYITPISAFIGWRKAKNNG